MSLLNGASILITGGTGSFGKAFLREVLDNHNPRRVVVFSRDELKQYEVRNQFGNDPRLRWFLGDIQNVIEASIDAGVKKVVALSTDKASSPINLYGATKLTADKLFITGNHYAASYDTRFAVVRYGNVMGSRGSVIPFFRRLGEEGKPLPITDMTCTRFFITLPQAVQMVIDTFELMQGGELLVPRIPSMKVTDLAQAVVPGAEMVDVGLRPGEKLHEEMISPEEGRRAGSIADGEDCVNQPDLATWGYKAPEGAVPVEPGFFFRSDSNDQWYTQQEIADIIEGGI